MKIRKDNLSNCISRSPDIAWRIRLKNDNPFGFTPYDSGEILGDYGFKEQSAKILAEIEEESKI